MSGGGTVWNAKRDRGRVETSRKQMVHAYGEWFGGHGGARLAKYCPSPAWSWASTVTQQSSTLLAQRPLCPVLQHGGSPQAAFKRPGHPFLVTIYQILLLKVAPLSGIVVPYRQPQNAGIAFSTN